MVVDTNAVEDALKTGLFAAQGHGTLGWAHQRFVEFLAARFLVRRQVDGARLRNLVSSGDNTGIPPQTRAVAVWLAALGAPIAKAIIRTDPEAFVSSGVVLPDDDTRAEVTHALLEAAAAGRLRDPLRHYGDLAHPDLGEQLRPLLGDVRSDHIARLVAVEIAADCRTPELSRSLLVIALSAQEPYHLRCSAALGVARSGDPELAPNLLPLARGVAGDDPDDELRGAALRALWPSHIGVEELVACLQRPGRSDYHGSHQIFLESFPNDLRDEDVPALLRWAAAYVTDHGDNRQAPRSVMLRLIKRLARRALRHIDEDETVQPLVQLLDCSGQGVLPADVAHDPHARRRLILAALDEHGDNADDGPRLLWDHGLLHADDLHWLYDQHAQAEIPPGRSAVAWLMARVFDPTKPPHRELAFEVASAREHDERAALLYEELFKGWIEEVKLQSEAAARMRESYRLRHGDRQARDDNAFTVWDIRDRVLALLQAVEEGDPDAYWRCDHWMTAEPGEFLRFGDLSDDLSRRPVWEHLDDAEQRRVLVAAQQYLLLGDPGTEEWLGTTILYPPATAGYRALVLLYTEAPSLLDELPHDEIWERWAPVIYHWRVTSDGGSAGANRALLRRAYGIAPDAVLGAVTADLSMEQRQETGLWGTTSLDAIWDRRLGDHIAGWIEDTVPEGRLREELIAILVKHEHPRGVEFALGDLSELHRRVDGGAAAHSIGILLASSAAVHWPAVRQKIERHPEFGKQVMLQVSDGAWDGLLSLEAQEVAWLYEWLANAFPPSEDPAHDGETSYWETPRDTVGRRRDRLPVTLARRGTEEALAALRRLVERSDQPLLGNALREAEEAVLERLWAPVRPQSLLQLLERPENRVVRTGDDLLAVVQASLERYQERL